MIRTFFSPILIALLPCAAWAQSPLPDMPAQFQQAMIAGPKGTINVRAVQGTKGGPSIGAEDVEIDILLRDQVIHQMKARLNDLGIASVPDVPVAMGVRPVVRVRHASVWYQEGGAEMNAEKRECTVDVRVYETTDQAPAWRIVERSLAAARVEGAMDVRERLVVENMGDRTWMGGPPDAQGRRTTITLPLPANAHNGELERGFFDSSCGAFTDAGLSIQVPLMPGIMVYGYGYLVPAPQGRADLSITPSVPVETLKVYVADDGTSVEPRGLRPNGTEIIGPARTRLYQGDKVGVGQGVGVVVSGLLATTDLKQTQAGSDHSKLFAIVGVGAVLLVGVVVVIWRRRSANAPLI